MKKLLLILLLVPLFSFGQESQRTPEEQEILAVIEKQRQDWNNFDLEGFMEGYWKSEELRFYGSNGVTSGWKSTLERYKKAYPTKDHTGLLKFVINEISMIEKNSYYVMGEFYLERSVGDTNGIFMILFRKIDGEWKIIADTSC
ncbi:MAG: nuclear transport factor 2 family protein [Lutimonas sp.]